MTQPLAIFVALAVSFAPAVAESRQTAPNGPLKIVVIAGEGAVNIIQYKTAVAPVVEIRDRNDQPVAGATVTFAISGGKNKGAAFASGAPSSVVTTKADGRAIADPITPLRKGAVQIQVSASFQGQTAAATIGQTNVMTAEQAKSSGSSGGGLSAGKIGLIAAAAGGAVFAVKSFNYKNEDLAPSVLSWIVTTTANGASITPCTSPATTCELKLSDNEGVVEMRVDITGITAGENKLVFDCGGCQMISGSGSQETFSFAAPPAHQGYTLGVQFPAVGVFPFRATWTSGGATLASFSILFAVVP